MSKFTIKQIFQDHWYAFLALKPNIRPVVYHEVSKIIDCGNPLNGYSLYRCPDCLKTLIVPFRCKSRFCSSCGRTYQLDRAQHISRKLFKHCQHRHIVFTLPDSLWPIFRKHRHLLHILFHSASRAILDYFKQRNMREEFLPGIVAVLHTFGRDLKWNPHIHILLTEGAYGRHSLWEPFHYISYDALRKRWQTIVLLSLSKALDDPEFKIHKSELFRKHSKGFYVNAPPASSRDPKQIINYIIRYIGRPPFAQSHIIDYDGQFVTFWYQPHGQNQQIQVRVPAIEFIARLIIHIPDRYFHMLRYYGLYAKPLTEKQRRHFQQPGVQKLYRQLKRWHIRIALTFGYDPRRCSCGALMVFEQVFVPNSIFWRPP